MLAFFPRLKSLLLYITSLFFKPFAPPLSFFSSILWLFLRGLRLHGNKPNLSFFHSPRPSRFRWHNSIPESYSRCGSFQEFTIAHGCILNPSWGGAGQTCDILAVPQHHSRSFLFLFFYYSILSLHNFITCNDHWNKQEKEKKNLKCLDRPQLNQQHVNTFSQLHPPLVIALAYILL